MQVHYDFVLVKNRLILHGVLINIFSHHYHHLNERTEYANLVLRKVVIEFFKNRILTFEEYKTCPVHFVGSIAYFSSDIIKEVADELGVTIGEIIRRPIDGLLDYHKGLLKNDSKLV